MNHIHSPEKLKRLHEKLSRECGDTILAALNDPMVIEIMLNPDGHVWIDHRERGLFDSGKKMTMTNAYNLIGTVADLRGKVINEKNEILETEFPLDGSRFEAAIPDVVIAPSFSLRKKALRVFTLNEYMHQGILDALKAAAIRETILNRQSILIVGGPGTGKTTLANAILNEMVELGDPHQRFVIIEDTRELQCNAKNTLSLKTTIDVDYQQLLRVALRSRPDKICMGECRGGEVLTLLKAWNTGTPGGLATIHANSAPAALTRISEMVQENGSVLQPNLICEAVNVVVSISFDPIKGRVVNEILRVSGYRNGNYLFEKLA